MATNAPSKKKTEGRHGQGKTVNLRVCARCQWIYRFSDPLPEGSEFDQGACPECGFASYSARYVFGPQAYRYSLTQTPWKNQQLANFEVKLNDKIDKSPAVVAQKKKSSFKGFFQLRKLSGWQLDRLGGAQ